MLLLIWLVTASFALLEKRSNILLIFIFELLRVS